MKWLLQFFFLALAPIASAQELSNASVDLDFLKGRNFLFHVVKDGRDYTKVFTCSSAAIQTAAYARLPCEGGLGEKWSAFAWNKRKNVDPQYFSFWQSDDEFVSHGGYMYSFAYDGGMISNATYSQSQPGGFTEALPMYVRWIDIDESESSLQFGTSGPLSNSLQQVVSPFFANGVIYLDKVQVGSSFYQVFMRQMPSTDGSLLLKVESATKR